jgi:hypothetical protein
VYGTGGNVAAFTRAIRVALPGHRQRHLATQNDVGGLLCVRVIRVRRVRRVLPYVRVPEAFLLELSRELLLVHSIILANMQPLRLDSGAENGYALPAALGDTTERARPSSGEKIV